MIAEAVLLLAVIPQFGDIWCVLVSLLSSEAKLLGFFVFANVRGVKLPRRPGLRALGRSRSEDTKRPCWSRWLACG